MIESVSDKQSQWSDSGPIKIVNLQGHVLLGQLFAHRIRGKDRRELADLKTLDSVRQRGGKAALVRIFKILASVAPLDLDVADLHIPGQRAL